MGTIGQAYTPRPTLTSWANGNPNMFFAPAIMLFLPAPMGDTSNPIGAPFSPYLFCAPAAMGDTSSPDRCTIFSLLVLRSCGMGDTSNPSGAPFSPYLFCAPAAWGTQGTRGQPH